MLCGWVGVGGTGRTKTLTLARSAHLQVKIIAAFRELSGCHSIRRMVPTADQGTTPIFLEVINHNFGLAEKTHLNQVLIPISFASAFIELQPSNFVPLLAEDALHQHNRRDIFIFMSIDGLKMIYVFYFC